MIYLKPWEEKEVIINLCKSQGNGQRHTIRVSLLKATSAKFKV